MGIACLVLATALWLPLMHIVFRARFNQYYNDEGAAPKAKQLAAHQIALWAKPPAARNELNRMRASCPEWDLMARTFLVLALTNMSLREPEAQERYLKVVDTIIEQTLQLEKDESFYYFLMDYGRYGSFVNKPARSLFLDGEIALMLGARQMVKTNQDYTPLLAQRVDAMVDYMSRGSVLSAESYPDECWTFCNSLALAAMVISDVLDGRDHSHFCRRWLDIAKAKLVDSHTGILYSSYTLEGIPKDGPEGSTIWTVSHFLQLIDEQFANEQYERAKRELACNILGFGFAREWPQSWKGPKDIDAGEIVPLVQVSPSSSGQAFVAARSFGDTEFLKALLASLRLGGFPDEQEGTLTFYACNPLGEAVLLYSMTAGPMWKKVKDCQSLRERRAEK